MSWQIWSVDISVPCGHRLLLVASGEHATRRQVRNQRIRQQRHTRTAAQIRVSQFRDYLLIECISWLVYGRVRVYALIVRRHRKRFRPSEQRPLWSISAKRRRMISLPDMWWGFIGSLDMPEYEAMRSPMSLQGAALLWDFLDLSQSWESLDKIYEKCSIVG